MDVLGNVSISPLAVELPPARASELMALRAANVSIPTDAMLEDDEADGTRPVRARLELKLKADLITCLTSVAFTVERFPAIRFVRAPPVVSRVVECLAIRLSMQLTGFVLDGVDAVADLARSGVSHAALGTCFASAGREKAAMSFAAAVTDEAKRIIGCSTRLQVGDALPPPTFGDVKPASFKEIDALARARGAALASSAVVGRPPSGCNRLIPRKEHPAHASCGWHVFGVEWEMATRAARTSPPVTQGERGDAAEVEQCDECGTQVEWSSFSKAIISASWAPTQWTFAAAGTSDWPAVAALGSGGGSCWPKGTTSDISKDYLYRSVYAPQLLRFAAALGQDAVGIMFDEYLRNEPHAAVADVLSFIGLDAPAQTAASDANELAQR